MKTRSSETLLERLHNLYLHYVRHFYTKSKPQEIIPQVTTCSSLLRSKPKPRGTETQKKKYSLGPPGRGMGGHPIHNNTPYGCPAHYWGHRDTSRRNRTPTVHNNPTLRVEKTAASLAAHESSAHRLTT